MRTLRGLLVLLLAFWVPAPVQASVEDFTFDSFDAVYELSRDEQGHSVLRVTEVLTARFPDFDQNRGIRREIPSTYLGTPLDLEIVRVTDGSGIDRYFETEYIDEFLVVTIAVPEGEFVKGVQTYAITYIARNVILTNPEGDVQEFYWDINGSGWPQHFGRVSATVEFDDAVAKNATGVAACYAGLSGDSTPCSELEVTETGLYAEHTNLGAHQTLTVAVQFAADTFAPRDNSYWASTWWPFHSVATLATVGLVFVSATRRFITGRNAPGRPTIVAEYGPPPGVSIYTVAALLRKPRRVFAASVIDLAVRGVIVIEEFDPPGLSKRGWALRLAELPSAPDADFVSALFGPGAAVGTRSTVSDPTAAVTQRIAAFTRRAEGDLVSLGMTRKLSGRRLVTVASVVVVMAIVLASFAMMNDARGGWIPVVTLIAGSLVGLVSFLWTSHTPLTEKGAEVRDHVAGLDLYIRVAETERLRVLQSPSGALKKPIDTTDARAIIHVYELVLPWAILLGREKEWSRVLEVAYSGESPGWYSGSVPFTASQFTSSVSSLTASADASSSGGSSGGGSAGGGGGGGGGGGV